MESTPTIFHCGLTTWLSCSFGCGAAEDKRFIVHFLMHTPPLLLCSPLLLVLLDERERALPVLFVVPFVCTSQAFLWSLAANGVALWPSACMILDARQRLWCSPFWDYPSLGNKGPIFENIACFQLHQKGSAHEGLAEWCCSSGRCPFHQELIPNDLWLTWTCQRWKFM